MQTEFPDRQTSKTIVKRRTSEIIVKRFGSIHTSTGLDPGSIRQTGGRMQTEFPDRQTSTIIVKRRTSKIILAASETGPSSWQASLDGPTTTVESSQPRRVRSAERGRGGPDPARLSALETKILGEICCFSLLPLTMAVRCNVCD